MQCERCGTGFNLTGLTSVCPVCGALPTKAETPPPPAVLPEQRTENVPMEDREYGDKLFLALIDTIRECLLSPVRFFAKVRNSTNQLAPLIFCLVLGSVGSLATFTWDRIFPTTIGESAFSSATLQNSTASTLIIAPFFMILGVFFVTAYIQIILTIFRKARAPFLMTFRMVAYTESSAIFMVIPWVGSFISIIYGIYLTLTGVRAVHSISRTHALLLFLLLPLVLLFILLILVVLIAVAVGIGASGSWMDFLPEF